MTYPDLRGKAFSLSRFTVMLDMDFLVDVLYQAEGLLFYYISENHYPE